LEKADTLRALSNCTSHLLDDNPLPAQVTKFGGSILMSTTGCHRKTPEGSGPTPFCLFSVVFIAFCEMMAMWQAIDRLLNLSVTILRSP
jgi:hypothetical protein